MEARLQQLQDKMKQQQLEESSKKSGTSNWKSATAEKGSVKNYAKDLQEKHRKRSEATGGGTALLSATSGGRRAQRANAPAGNFRTLGEFLRIKLFLMILLFNLCCWQRLGFGV